MINWSAHSAVLSQSYRLQSCVQDNKWRTDCLFPAKYNHKAPPKVDDPVQVHIGIKLLKVGDAGETKNVSTTSKSCSSGDITSSLLCLLVLIIDSHCRSHACGILARSSSHHSKPPQSHPQGIRGGPNLDSRDPFYERHDSSIEYRPFARRFHSYIGIVLLQVEKLYKFNSRDQFSYNGLSFEFW